MSHLHKGRLAQINDALDDPEKERGVTATCEALTAAMGDTVEVVAPKPKKIRVASRIPRKR